MKINNFTSPVFIFIFCIFAIFVNIISSIHFFPILLIGTLFMVFFFCIQNSYYYSLIFLILTIILIESNIGFKPLSLVLLMIFTYFFVNSYVNRVLALNNTLNSYIHITVFYIGFYILSILNIGISEHLNYLMLINFIIDFIVFGILI